MNVVDLVTRHIPEGWFAQAVTVVTSVAGRMVDNDTKREAAVTLLRDMLHVSEHVARVLVELGVLSIKTSGRHPTAGTDHSAR
jgi:hypothetical protein